MFQGRRIALVVLSALLTLCSCRASPDGARNDAAFHPGEADAVRSAQVQDEVKTCAEDRGWHLGNLELLVDGEGRLIRIAYRSRNIFPGTLEREAVDSCLARAGVTQPPGNL